MRLFLLLTITLFTFFIFSCKGDNNDPTAPEVTISGSWTRIITDAQGLQFTAELKFNGNNTYDFILLSDTPGHTNSTAEFTLKDDQITIINDTDCGVDGIYNFTITTTKLTLTAVNDQCTPRKAAIEGVWTNK